MAWQLIYTSAPRGLVAGRSGFCTVARHREIRDGLVTAIERFSQYDRSGRAAGSPSPVVYAHRIVRLGGSSFHVLSCTRDAGADYTGRTNHLAHHLICEPHELANAPSPPEVLRQMAWQRVWTDAPRYFGLEEVVDLRRFHRTAELPAQTWQGVTGDAGCAAMPLESGALAGCFWLYPAEAGEQHLLPLVAESLLLLDPSGRSPEKLWQVPFTTYLQATDHAADFFWRGCWQGAPAANAAQSARQTLDFTQPRNLRAPENQIADMARRGRTAAPEKTAVAPAAAVTPMETAAPVALAGSGDHHLDLAELLASADKADPTRRAPPPNVAPPVAGKVSVTRSAGRRDAGKRMIPLKLIITAVAAIMVSGALALLFVGWQDGVCAELTKARNDEKFLEGRKRAEGIWKSFRISTPLKVEIERTLVAADLNDLKSKTPNDANSYLVQNRERLAAPSIQSEDQIARRIGKLHDWWKADERLSVLLRRIDAESFREPTAGDAIKKSFDDEVKAISMLDEPYRRTIETKLVDTKQRYVSRRIETLEKTMQGGARPDKLAEIIRDLMSDAKSFAVAQPLNERIDKLDEQRQKQSTAVVPEPPAKPATLGQFPAKPEEPKHSLGLPEMTTYIAVSSVIGFDISGVTEMQGGKEFRADGKWLLLRNPQPVLSPQNATWEECSIIGKKLYVKTDELITLQTPQLVMSPTAKDSLRESFLLRFTPEAGAPQGFQLLFQAGESSALLRLPTRDSLVWDKKYSTITLSTELANALRKIKLAANSKPELLFRAARWDDRAIPMGDLSAAVQFSLPSIPKMAAPVETPISTQNPAKKNLVEEERARAAEKARNHIKAAHDGKKPPLPDINDGRAYVTYMQGLFKKLSEDIESEHTKLKAEIKNLDQTKKKQGEEKKEKTDRIHQLTRQKTLVEAIVDKFTTGLKKEPWDDATVVWTKLDDFPALAALKEPSKAFHNEWSQVFKKEYLDEIRPFLQWNRYGKEGDLDKALGVLKDQKAPLAPPGEKEQPPPKTSLKDITSLGPFSIDLNAIRLVNFIDGPSVGAVEPVKSPK